MTRIVLSTGNDSLIWLPGRGCFTSKKFSQLCTSNFWPSLTSARDWTIIWSAKLPLKISIFLWKLNWGVQPTSNFLNSKVSQIPFQCVWCSREQETIDYLFWRCELASWAWEFIGKWWSNNELLQRTMHFSLSGLLKLYDKNQVTKVWSLIVAETMWSIWLA